MRQLYANLGCLGMTTAQTHANLGWAWEGEGIAVIARNRRHRAGSETKTLPLMNTDDSDQEKATDEGPVPIRESPADVLMQGVLCKGWNPRAFFKK
jgi:hypothetical protein